MGQRPPKLTPAVWEALVKCAREGLSIRKMCRIAGISYSTLYDWRVQADRGWNSWCRRLFEDLLKADAESEQLHLGNVYCSALGTHPPQTETKRKYLVTGGGDGQPIRRILIEETVKEKTYAPKWLASAWLLEKRFPERYGEKATHRDPEEIARMVAAAAQGMYASVPTASAEHSSPVQEFVNMVSGMPSSASAAQTHGLLDDFDDEQEVDCEAEEEEDE
jgi:transposase-like protein